MPTLFIFDDTLKMLRETFCVAQAAVGDSSAGDPRSTEHIERIQRVINEIDRQRPIGPDGKHGNRHTLTCGCEDR